MKKKLTPEEIKKIKEERQKKMDGKKLIKK
jgi:hypothetical protein